MENKNIKKQTVFNLIVSYLGIFLGFFNTFFKAKVITSEEIGLIAVISGIASILSYFNLIGIPNVILKYFPKISGDKKKENGFIFVFFTIISFLFVLIVCFFIIMKPYFIDKYSSNVLFKEYYIYVLLFLFFSVYFTFLNTVMNVTFNSVYPSFIKEIYKRILHFVILMIVFLNGLDFKYYFYSYIFLEFSSVFILFLSFLKSQKFSFKLDFSFFKDFKISGMVSYSLFMFFSGFAGNIVSQIDKIMLGYFNTLSSTGIYTISLTFSDIIAVLGSSLSKTTHPKISYDLKNNNIWGIESDYKNIGDLQFFIALFIFCYLAVFSKELLGIFGDEYKNGYIVLIILAFSQVVNLATSICGGIIALSEHYKFDFYSRMILLVLNIILNVIFIPYLGINGAAIATGISLILYNIMKVIFVYFKFKILPFSFNYIKTFISNFILFGIVLIVKLNFAFSYNILLLMFIGLFLLIFYVLIMKYLFIYKNAYFDIIFNKFVGRWLK